ncbi:Bifunctional protein MdtA [Caulifigura coniformis]|uniref:Bifunctional protein MdtA n=1 Tax=Caulifigura coniformis TaxID=2527983 RepID=A0A517S8J3_9PLAN|nr:NAD(P)-dependent methylenetetrahydromethanopterin dehydrogenase [Caulifigura coniformis]QDT52451.1 Bifunctional protein MdtA [Caulifigura coniformis]
MKRILIQLDTDALPSVFDRVVAIDAGVDELFSYGGVTPENVTGLVHGAIFTRGPADLKNTALFIGGSNVAAGEALLKAVKKAFFGPMRVSVLMDSNGSNTTAAAAVFAATKHIKLAESTALVLGGTGPVGHRAAQILASQGTQVRVASREKSKAETVCQKIRDVVKDARVTPVSSSDTPAKLLEGCDLLIAAGAAGVQFFKAEEWQQASSLKVAIDLNAVPPEGLAGIGVTDKAVAKGPITTYGAIGVGGLKMKIHRAAIQNLFEANDRLLDTAAVYDLAAKV